MSDANNSSESPQGPMLDGSSSAGGPWYKDVTSYQWLVLLIASLGWVFDVFEGQIFVASMKEAMPSLLPEGTPQTTIDFYNKISLATFLLGGALGGIYFGMLSDRIGRTKTMIITILIYSGFTCITVFAQTWWQMAGLRFLVGMGIGGEWAVAAAMVSEVFPKKARAWSGAIFHGSSVFGTYLAIAAGVFLIGNENLFPENPDLRWRVGFLIGAIPALLTLWIRWRLREPEKWIKARAAAKQDSTKQTGRILELFSSENIRSTFVGVSLAAIGLATFWGIHINGKNSMRRNAELRVLQEEGVSPDADKKIVNAVLKKHESPIKKREMLGMFLATTGGGLGLIAFGPLCEWLGRRGAFLFFHVGGFGVSFCLFKYMYTADDQFLYVLLPVFGFLTLGMHAGYAIYFPEMFPTRLRGTGSGFCFNAGRIIAAPILLGSGWMQDRYEINSQGIAVLLSFLFLLAVIILFFARETRGQELQE